MANTTLMMIKPDAVENGHIGNILEKVTSAGFKIKALKLTQLTKRDAETFYEVHSERPFFGTLIGATNPAEAAEGTLRKLYATSMGENAVHGSDSDENASIEAAFHFSKRECF
jgi:nucleoside-diphosphate kinase